MALSAAMSADKTKPSVIGAETPRLGFKVTEQF